MARRASPNISWVKDGLPELSYVLALGQVFDLVLLCAVWQHICAVDRRIALSALRSLTVDGGKVIMSIRHGAGAPSRPVFPASVEDTVKWSEAQGFIKVDEFTAQSVQSGNQEEGVTWTWLVLQTDPHEAHHYFELRIA